MEFILNKVNKFHILILLLNFKEALSYKFLNYVKLFFFSKHSCILNTMFFLLINIEKIKKLLKLLF